MTGDVLSIRRAAAEVGDRTAVVTATERLTFAELAAATAALPDGAGPVELIAVPSVATIIQIAAALEHGRPLVLLHPRLPAAQQASHAEAGRTLAIPDDTLAVMFTSGSTAEPRPIALGRGPAIAAAAASAAHLGWRDDDAWLACVPLAHVAGLAIVVRCLIARRPIVLATDPSPVAIAALATRERATLASLVPAQLVALLDHPMPALRAVLLGGAAAPRPIRATAVARGIPILTTYGMTETWGQVATQPVDRAGRLDDGIGVALPGVAITAGSAGAPGPIAIRGPIAPGGVTTRDLGWLDPRGWLHVVGRSDDVIITGGENVHPAVVEDIVGAAPGVAEACVVGVPDPRWGQRIVAAVVLAPGGELDRVIAHARDRLAPHQRPREWRVVEALPHTASGKLDRRGAARAVL